MKNEDLINIIENNLINSSKTSNSNGKFYPSSVGQCSRKIVYGMLNYECGKKSADILKIMDIGTSIHNSIEKMFKSADLLIAAEASFALSDDEGNFLCSGRTDAVIKNFREHESSENIIKIYSTEHELDENGRWLKDENGSYVTYEKLVYEGPDNDVILIEIKSINKKTYDKLLPKKDPKREHELQLQMYLDALKVKYGIVFYSCKDNQKFLQFDIEYDKEKADTAKSQAKLCIYCRDNNVLPQREFEKESFECIYCDYLKYCYPDMYELRVMKENLGK